MKGITAPCGTVVKYECSSSLSDEVNRAEWEAFEKHFWNCKSCVSYEALIDAAKRGLLVRLLEGVCYIHMPKSSGKTVVSYDYLVGRSEHPKPRR